MKKIWMILALLFAALNIRAFAAGKAHPKKANPTSARSKTASDGAKGTLVRVAPDVNVYASLIRSGRDSINVWTYMPAKVAAGAKLPLIVIAPAGSYVYSGMSIGAGDMPEHLPYVRAGYAVVTYQLLGEVSAGASQDEMLAGALSMRAARFGVRNAVSALDHTLKYFPIDTKRIFAAGHSSAATLALVVGAEEPRVRAVVAYAPVTDVEDYLGEPMLSSFDEQSPGFKAYIHRNSPLNQTRQLKKPVFLFHADDDSVVSLNENAIYWNKLRQTNKRVTFVRVATGDHHDSMINQGIPSAMAWLKKIK